MTEQAGPSGRRGRPLGVSLLATLLFLVGMIWLLSALTLPFSATPLAPWYIVVGAAAYFLSVGWGLWSLRRWAYLAALLMCVVLGFYQARAALLLGPSALVLLLALAVIFVYLLRPRVRAVFLAADERRSMKIEDRR